MSTKSPSARYQTIVVDPPWSYPEGWPALSTSPVVTRKGYRVANGNERLALPYASMGLSEIESLPVSEIADEHGCHFYLWTTNRYLRQAFGVFDAWGVRYGQTLVWAKKPKGIGPGGTFSQNAEYVLFGRRGTRRHLKRVDSVWYQWPRSNTHSKKPEEFFSLVQSVSPGPYLEMFARAPREGWDVWGDEVESDVSLVL